MIIGCYVEKINKLYTISYESALMKRIKKSKKVWVHHVYRIYQQIETVATTDDAEMNVQYGDVGF